MTLDLQNIIIIIYAKLKPEVLYTYNRKHLKGVSTDIHFYVYGHVISTSASHGDMAPCVSLVQ